MNASNQDMGSQKIDKFVPEMIFSRFSVFFYCGIAGIAIFQVASKKRSPRSTFTGWGCSHLWRRATAQVGRGGDEGAKNMCHGHRPQLPFAKRKHIVYLSLVGVKNGWDLSTYHMLVD